MKIYNLKGKSIVRVVVSYIFLTILTWVLFFISNKNALSIILLVSANIFFIVGAIVSYLLMIKKSTHYFEVTETKLIVREGKKIQEFEKSKVEQVFYYEGDPLHLSLEIDNKVYRFECGLFIRDNLARALNVPLREIDTDGIEFVKPFKFGTKIVSATVGVIMNIVSFYIYFNHLEILIKRRI